MESEGHGFGAREGALGALGETVTFVIGGVATLVMVGFLVRTPIAAS